MNRPSTELWSRQGNDAVSPRSPFCSALLLGAAAPAENLSIFDPLSPPANEIRDMLWLVLAITGAIFLVVEFVLIYCIIRFRQRRSAPAHEPPQIYGSKPIELAWTVAPALIVFVLFLVVVRVVGQIRKDQPPEGALVVRVIGHQWWWEYQYTDPDMGFTTANELVVPVNRPVFLHLDSADVIHSFWVPRLAGKTDVIPGRVNHMWFEAQEPRLFLGQCAEYCGTQHANMLLIVDARSESDFAAWVEGQKKKPDGADLPENVAAGRDLFLNIACMNCHTIHGTPARGTVGPDLTHLMSRNTLAAGVVPNDAEGKNLFQWLKNPNTIKPGCRMPDMQLSDAQVKALVDYLTTLH